MTECVACDTELGATPYRCRYCEEPVCDEHRLPENHACVYQSLADAPARDYEPGRNRSRARSETSTATPLRKDTSDPDRATFGSAPPRSPSSSDPPTSKSPPVETKSAQTEKSERSPVVSTLGAVASFVPKAGVVILAIVGAIAIMQSGVFTSLTDGATPEAPENPAAAVSNTSTASPTITETSPTLDETRAEEQVLQRVNDIRRDRELQTLQKYPQLTRLATTHTENMVEHDYYSHESPSGAPFHERAKKYAPHCSSPTENIHRAPLSTEVRIYGSEQVVNTRSVDGLATYLVQGWLNSPEHRENLLAADINGADVSIRVSDGGVVYATMAFGSC